MKKNNVKLVVNLGTNPGLRHFKSGKRMAIFSVASVEPDPETKRNEVKWYSVIAWNNLADVAQKYLTKGKRVMVCGNHISKEWYDKKGILRHREEILATDLILLSTGKVPAVKLAA
ncbi:MAG: single-stranded DNA-binding protein [Bacteroidetes bacterium]|nr:single-stranded DNA-binding protein [Bacteroidota bacterium]